MRQKILVITNCLKCNFVNCDPEEGLFCDNPARKFKSCKELVIEDIRVIPEWCPLEDAKTEAEDSK